MLQLVRCHAIHDVNFHVALSVDVNALFIDLDVEDAVCTISLLVVFKITLNLFMKLLMIWARQPDVVVFQCFVSREVKYEVYSKRQTVKCTFFNSSHSFEMLIDLSR